MLDIAAIKSEGAILFNELGINYKPAIKKYSCPFHSENTPSLEVTCEKGAWLFYCFGCGASGSVIDARMKRLNLRCPGDALSSMEKDFGFRFSQADRAKALEAPVPIIDLPRAEHFITTAHELLMDRLDLQEKWMLGKRGLTIEVCQKYRIGFMESFGFKKWPNWKLQNAWVLPLTDSAGHLLSVKIHFETRPIVAGKPQGPKCISAPFGTEPREEPRNAWTGLWPAPEVFQISDNTTSLAMIDTDNISESINSWSDDKRIEFSNKVNDLAAKLYEPYRFNEYASPLDYIPPATEQVYEQMRGRNEVLNSNDWIFLCPGELKALAMIAAGKAATSITSGESQKVPQRELMRLVNRPVCLVFDDDEAGRKWQANLSKQLLEIASKIGSMSYGRVMAAA